MQPAVTAINTEGAPGSKFDAEKGGEGRKGKGIDTTFPASRGGGAPGFIEGGLYLLRELFGSVLKKTRTPIRLCLALPLLELLYISLFAPPPRSVSAHPQGSHSRRRLTLHGTHSRVSGSGLKLLQGDVVNEMSAVRLSDENPCLRIVILPSIFHEEARQRKGHDGQIEEEKEGKSDELGLDEDGEDSKSEDVDGDEQVEVESVGGRGWIIMSLMKMTVGRHRRLGSEGRATIDEDPEDEDLPLDIDDDQGSQVTFLVDDNVGDEKDDSDAHDVLSLVDGSNKEDLVSLGGDVPR